MAAHDPWDRGEAAHGVVDPDQAVGLADADCQAVANRAGAHPEGAAVLEGADRAAADPVVCRRRGPRDLDN